MEHSTRSKDGKRESQNEHPKDNLRQVEGKTPAKDKEKFTEALDLVVQDFQLTKPTEVMLANRMVATFMQLQFIEGEIKKHGLFFGTKENLRMNPMLDHQSKLQNDLMRFYRMFNAKRGLSDEGPKTFIDFMENAKDKSKKAKE